MITGCGWAIGSRRWGLQPKYSYKRQVGSGPKFTQLTVVGRYATDESAGFWFERPYFVALGTPKKLSLDPYQDALFTLPSTMSPLQLGHDLLRV